MAIWVIKAGRGAEYEQRSLDENKVFLPIENITSDITQHEEHSRLRTAMVGYTDEGENVDGVAEIAATWAFSRRIAKGDWIVLVPDLDESPIHVGEVTSDCQYDSEDVDNLRFNRGVTWLVQDLSRTALPDDLLDVFKVSSMIFRMSRSTDVDFFELLARNDWKMPERRHSHSESLSAETLTDKGLLPSLTTMHRRAIARGVDWDVLAEQALIEQEPLRAKRLLYGIAGAVLLLVFWAAIAEIDTVTRGQGKVIPSRQLQVIGSQDGGVITEILVREGDSVQKGQLLLKLDQTRSLATLGESRAELAGLTVRAARLRAVVDDTAFQPTAKMLADASDIVSQEMHLYRSTLDELGVQQDIASQQLTQRREELSELVARESQLDTELELASRELFSTRPMIASGAVSEVEILRLEREVNKADGELKQTRAQLERVKASIAEAQGKLRGVKLEFVNEAREQLADTVNRINALTEATQGLSDRVRQTNLTSPVNGTIKQLFYNTEGGVVLPGRDIIELVPADDTLLVEVRVRPQDIAFLAPGQVANVKVTAYDFVVYGGLKGKVEQIGADTVVDEEGNAFYDVRVRTENAEFGVDKPIIPGMTVEVDILTGKRTILAYLMKPILRAHQRALSER